MPSWKPTGGGASIRSIDTMLSQAFLSDMLVVDEGEYGTVSRHRPPQAARLGLSRLVAAPGASLPST
jgi:hypothetical protein